VVLITEFGKKWTEEKIMAKLKLDLHDIYNRGETIEKELNRVMQEAVEKRIKIVEIIPGKGSGQLKKRVIRFLDQKHIRNLYHRIEKDDKNFGRIFVHFRH
jgi:DNA-nicking Smr family endonuclease